MKEYKKYHKTKMNKKIKNTYDKLIEKGLTVVIISDDLIRIIGKLETYNLNAYSLWEIIRHFGTTFGLSNDVNNFEEIDITIGYECPEEILKMYEEIHNEDVE